MWNKWTFDDVVKCNNNNHQTVVTLVCEHLLPMYIRWLCMYFNNSIVNKSKWLLAFDASFIWNNNYCCFWCFIVIITYFQCIVCYLLSIFKCIEDCSVEDCSTDYSLPKYG